MTVPSSHRLGPVRVDPPVAEAARAYVNRKCGDDRELILDMLGLA